MPFPWEVDAQPIEERAGKRAKAKAAKQGRTLSGYYRSHRGRAAGSRQHNHLKSGHPSWYSEYLKTAHWRRFKDQYRSSGRQRCCAICGDRRYELHHRTYEHVGEERLDDVVALCRRHHARAHKREKAGVPLWDAHLEGDSGGTVDAPA